MGALAKDSTLQSVLEGMTGYVPVRTAKVTNITFTASQFETGQIDTSTGENKSGSGFYRTTDYIAMPSNFWLGQLYADKPWIVRILYYDENKVYKEFQMTMTGCATLKNYPYYRLYFYSETSYLSLDDFLENSLKIQYIESAPAANEYFLHNQLFNGNFKFDRNSDGIADGWTLKNSPTSPSVSDNVQTLTPASANYFIQMDADTRLTGHVIYVAFTAYSPYATCYISLYGINVIISTNTGFTRSSQLITANNSNVSPRIAISSGGQSHPISLKNVMVIDLTEIYGSGNEPTAAQIDAIIDKYYGGYVPCEYVVKYDDTDAPADVISLLKDATGTDVLTFSNGAVTTVNHYVGSTLKATATINRDMFGNIVSIEEARS